MTHDHRAWWLCALMAGCARGVSPGTPTTASELVLEVTISLTGPRSAILRSGDEVASGDEILVAVKPTAAAHVYLAYCDPRNQLALFPGNGGLAASPGRITYAPAPDAAIVLDDQPGQEVLYVIASLKPLDVADPRLAGAISRTNPGPRVECGEPLDRALAADRAARTDTGATSPPTPPAEPETSPDAALSQDPLRPGPPNASPARAVPPHTAYGSLPPPHPAAPPRVPPPAEVQRGGFIRFGTTGAISASGDHHDIVVLRYEFTHIAAHDAAR